MLPSESIAKLYSIYGIKTEKKIVHLGLDIKHFKPAVKSSAKKQIVIDPKKKVIGFVGRIGEDARI